MDEKWLSGAVDTHALTTTIDQPVEVEGEGRKHMSQRLVDLRHEIDVDCTDALNALYSVVKL